MQFIRYILVLSILFAASCRQKESPLPSFDVQPHNQEPTVSVLEQEKDVASNDEPVNIAELSYDELAELITSRKVYDPKTFGLDTARSTSNTQKHALHILSIPSRLKKEFSQISSNVSGIRYPHPDKREEIKASFPHTRQDFAFRLIRLQCFFENVIDKERAKAGFEYPIRPSVIERDPKDIARFMSLTYARLIGELPDCLKPELEKYHEASRVLDEKLKQWALDLVEYDLQTGLVRQRTETLKETHELLVQLYSLEPRADEELLALIKDTKYPEKEKVALLMELGIPYGDYRIWESQDGLFKANAKYVSFDEKEGVTLEKADGKQTTIELDVLRTEDQEYVRQRVHLP